MTTGVMMSFTASQVSWEKGERKERRRRKSDSSKFGHFGKTFRFCPAEATRQLTSGK